MARIDYQDAQKLADKPVTFSAIIMAAMKRAAPANLDKLREAWPGVYHEMSARERAYDDCLPSERSKGETCHD